MNKLRNKRLAFLGLGVENLALVKYLLSNRLQAEFVICDFRSWQELGERFEQLNKLAKRSRVNLKWQLGESFNQKLYQFDYLFRSPGWTLRCPGILEAKKKLGDKIVITSALAMFLELSPSKNIIGVTGTKGKGTTSTLIYEILKAGKKRVWLGGNIGVAPFDFIKKIKASDWVVLEISSFQLEDLKISPKIAVLTNFTREHLAPADPKNPNYHLSMKDYWLAKTNIFNWQKKSDVLVVNQKLVAKLKPLEIKSKQRFFTKSALPSRLMGEHNQENIAAALEVAKLAGIKSAVAAKTVQNFKGLEHRLELVREFKGVKYYNDTFATTPEAAITALKSFDSPIILLAGGSEKRSDFKLLLKEIKKRVKFLVLLKGEATLRLADELLVAGYDKNQLQIVDHVRSAEELSEQAVRLAARQAKAGEIVLLSPACASFGLFNNYKERGNLFKAAVKKLK